MKARTEKFFREIKVDPAGTVRKTIVVLFSELLSFFDDLSFIIARFFLRFPSTKNLVRLHSLLRPVSKVDYKHKDIFLHADSEMSIFRSRACAKEPETVAWIEKNIKPYDVFYDVGANVGAYSFVAAKFLDNKAQIYSFEPSFSTYYQLCKNVVLNGCQESVFPYMIALADRTDLLTFHYRSLEGGSADHFLESDQSLRPRAFTSVYRQDVFSFSIDTLVGTYRFPCPQHIKLDVDGAEYDVLLGASKTIATGCVKSVLVEVRTIDGQDEKIVGYLCSNGFKLVSRHDRGDGIIWNYVFVSQR